MVCEAGESGGSDPQTPHWGAGRTPSDSPSYRVISIGFGMDGEVAFR